MMIGALQILSRLPSIHTTPPLLPINSTMSLAGTLRGAQGVIGRNVLISQQHQPLPALAYMRNTFALVQQRQNVQQRQSVRLATTSAKVATTQYTPEEALKMLNEQRSLRPNSPHLTIYEPQLTWVGSIANRVTGVGLSACALAIISREVKIIVI